VISLTIKIHWAPENHILTCNPVTIRWRQDGAYHRVDGPAYAILYSNGHERYSYLIRGYVKTGLKQVKQWS